MLPLNLALQEEQDQRIAADLDAEANRADQDLYYEGRFDGVTGGQPARDKFVEQAYRTGWLIGTAEYWEKQFGLDKEPEFDPEELIF